MKKRHFELTQSKLDLAEELSRSAGSIKDVMRDAIERKNIEIDKLEQEISDVENIEKDFIEFLKFAVDFIENLQAHFWELEPKDKVMCKQLAFPGGISIDYDLKVYTPEVSPILSLIGNKKDPSTIDESLLVELRGVAPLSKPKLYIVST